MQTVRDDTYLIGKKLHNLKNDTNQQQSASSSTIENGVAL